jgi:alpha-beta hydrolase superfamily lysophospholipase
MIAEPAEESGGIDGKGHGVVIQAETFRHRAAEARPVELAGQAWRVASPRATVMVAHGVNEHLGRYGGVVEVLTGAGFSVVGHDHRGHGRSDGRRGHVDDFDDYARDLVAHVERERGLAPDGKVVLLGHSMGGLIAARAALLAQGHSAQDQLAALVLSAPALAVGHRLPGWQKRVVLMVARFFGRLPTPPGKPGSLSRDPAVEEAFGRDPLNNLERTRLRLARQISLGGDDALARAGELRLPLLVMHGTADTITDPAGSAELVARAASADKELKLWPDNRHEILNDLDKTEVLAYLVGWLETRFPRVEG